MGYGTRALELLEAYYEGKFTNLDEAKTTISSTSIRRDEIPSSSKLLEEKIVPRKNLPPLLQKLAERPAENLDYIGTSFGLTPELFKFWNRNGYAAIYLRQTPVRFR
jgi:N-acetyltransferase 10